MNPRPPRETKPSGKVSPVWFIIVGASVALSAALLIIRPSLRPLQHKVEPVIEGLLGDTVAAGEAPIPRASNPRHGMGLRRLPIVGAFSARPYDFRFRDGRPLNDESNYLGFSNALPRASVQILGSPDDITEVAYTDVILADTVWKAAAGSAARELTRSIDGDMMPWVIDNFKKVNAGRSCFASKTVGGRTWTISYSQLGPEGHFLIRVGLPRGKGSTTP
jgi:hypothetical protein